MKEYWVVPCNPKYFDLQEHLKTTNEVAFKKLRPLNADNEVFIYVAAPFSQIMHRGIVTKAMCSEDDLQNHPYALKIQQSDNKRFFMIEILESFADGSFPYADLKANDIGQTQGSGQNE